MSALGHASAGAAETSRLRLRTLGRGPLVVLGIILALGFGLRLASALDPVPDPGPDAVAYERIAYFLFEEGRYGSPAQTSPSDWSPGAPLLYAGLYFVIGEADPQAARILVAVLGTVMILLVFLLALRLAGVVAGLLASALVATYPTFIENTGQLLSEPLAAMLLTAVLLGVLWAGERRRVLAWAVPGLALGALALVRPEYLAFSVVFAALAALRAWPWREGRWRRALGSAVVLLVGVSVVIAPWTVRNYLVLDKLVPVSTGGGKALFVATYLPGGGRQVPTKRDLMRRYLGAEDPITTEELRAQEMTPLLDRVANRYPDMPRDAALARIGRENLRGYLSEQPLAYLKMTALKAWNMWERGSSPAMRGAGWVAYHRGLLLVGLAGLVVLAWRRRTRFAALLLAAPIAGISVLGAILLAVPRRQVPLIPIFCVLAAVAVVWLARRLLERRRGEAAAPSSAPDARPAAAATAAPTS